MTDSKSRQVRKAWLDAWLDTERKVQFPREVCDAFREIKVTAAEVQDAVNVVMVTEEKKRTKEEQKLLDLYRSIKQESGMSIAEYASTTPTGSVFLLKSIHGLEDKQTVQIESGSLAQIIQDNTVHNGENAE